jgi:hypothetical protein
MRKKRINHEKPKQEVQNSKIHCQPQTHLFMFRINSNMYELICNKNILYNGLSNYIRYEVIKICIINRV